MSQKPPEPDGPPRSEPGGVPDGHPLPADATQPLGQVPGEPAGQAFPASPSGHPGPEAAPPWTTGPQEPGGPERRRGWVVPVILTVVVLVLAGVAAYLFFGRGDDAPAAEETTSAAVTSATGETSSASDDRTVSTEPLEPRLDTTVVNTSFALTDAGWTTDEEAIAAGAREALSGTYSDGSTDVPVTAAAFADIEGQDAYSEQLAADLEAGGATSQGEGSVYADNTGHYWYYVLEDGVTIALVWRTDNGVVLTLTGPADAVQTVYRNMLI
ncbi:hypothetical protein [Georgenia yuyongxinii]